MKKAKLQQLRNEFNKIAKIQDKLIKRKITKEEFSKNPLAMFDKSLEFCRNYDLQLNIVSERIKIIKSL
jgi:hypothetical protein